MEKISFLMIYLFFFRFVMPIPHESKKDLTKLKMINKDSINELKSQISRNLENDNYIVLYFTQDCYYSSGFVNEYRNDIDFIINENNKNIKYTKEEPFNVIKAYGIEIHFNKNISSLNSFFDSDKDENMLYLMSVNFRNFNSISISDTRYMFRGCSSLESIDLSNVDTFKVTDMFMMFDGCNSLKSIDLSNFDTSKVTNMGYIFYGCSSLKSIDLSNFVTSLVTYMDSMFYNCQSLTFIDLSNFDTSKVIDMESMFRGCSSLKSIDLSNFDTSKVTNMGSMFYGCSALQSIGLTNFDTSKVYDIGSLFYGCSSLKSIDLSNFDISQVTNMRYMFYGCSSLISIDLSNFDTSKVIDMYMMFDSCYSLKSINLSNFDTSKVNDMGSMFYECSLLESIDLSHFDTSKVTNMRSMFSSCSLLESIDLSHFDTSKVIDMRSMFYGCSLLESIDLSNFDTSKVTDMASMFYNCYSLKSIDLSNFDLINCNSYDDMFSDISSIRFINIYYLKNDKIIAKTFNSINNPIFVCQKDKIIDNSKAYNCCDSNFEAYECISPNNDIQLSTDNYTKSSKSLSAGAIVGIVLAGVAAIIGSISLICYFCKCPCKKRFCPLEKEPVSFPQSSFANQVQNETITKIDFNKDKNTSSGNLRNNNKNDTVQNKSVTNVELNQGKNPKSANLENNNKNYIIEYKPEKDMDNPMKIIFVNQSLGDTHILIDSKETIDELIKFYCEQIRRKDWYENKSILFLIDGKNIIPPYPKEPIETLINKVVNSETIRIIVKDNQ